MICGKLLIRILAIVLLLYSLSLVTKKCVTEFVIKCYTDFSHTSVHQTIIWIILGTLGFLIVETFLTILNYCTNIQKLKLLSIIHSVFLFISIIGTLATTILLRPKNTDWVYIIQCGALISAIQLVFHCTRVKMNSF